MNDKLATQMVSVRYIGPVRNFPRIPVEMVPLPEPGSVRSLLLCLVQKYGDGFEYLIFTEGGYLNNMARILIGDDEVTDLPQGLDTVVPPETEITIITLVSLAGG